MSKSDVVIRGGLVVDGSGSPGRIADVAIRDGRILYRDSNHVTATYAGTFGGTFAKLLGSVHAASATAPTP